MNSEDKKISHKYHIIIGIILLAFSVVVSSYSLVFSMYESGWHIEIKLADPTKPELSIYTVNSTYAISEHTGTDYGDYNYSKASKDMKLPFARNMRTLSGAKLLSVRRGREVA